MARRKKGGCCLFLFVMPIGLFIASVIITLIAYFFFARNYKEWVAGFEGSHMAEEYIYFNDEGYKGIKEQLDTKLAKFNSSTAQVDFVDLTKDEAAVLIAESLSTSLPQNISLYRIYIEAEAGKWTIYLQTKLRENRLPWLVLVIEKDNYETAQLYCSDIIAAGFSFDNAGVDFLIDRVNTGLSEGVNLVNDNDYSGRIIQNIELEADGVYIKGKLR